MRTVFQQHILTILAQQSAQQAAPVPANTTTGPTTVAGSPTTFDPFQFFPTMTVGWGANNATPIRRLSNVLNNALYVLSNGGLDINRMRANNFMVDVSKYPDVVLRGVIRYIGQVYRFLFTNFGQAFTGPVQDKTHRIQVLKNVLITFQIPDGGINQFLNNKIGGNLKPIIIDTLSLIK